MEKEKMLLQEKIEFNNIDELLKNMGLLEHVKDNVLLVIRSYGIGDKINFDEKDYYNKLNFTIDSLSKYDKNYNLQFDVINRKIFNKIFKINNIPINVKLYLKIDFHPEINIRSSKGQAAYLYSIDEYVEEEKMLNNITKPIMNNQVSSLEKYLYIYNVVKNFKPYKECTDNPYESRTLKHILKNDYMVCVGYSILLKTLLDRIDISCSDLDVYYSLYNEEDDKVEFTGHQRNLVRIYDEKYNINGIYISDPTFDNDMDNDFYDNCLVNINKRIQLDKQMLNGETCNNIFNLLFNFKDNDDFKEKMNIDKLSNLWKQEKNDCYKKIFTTIMELLQDLDNDTYQKLYNKYYKSIKQCLLYEYIKKFTATIYNSPNENIETIFDSFLDDYCSYIISITSNEVKMDVILEASHNLKKAVNNF